MQLIIKDGKIIATHTDEQNVARKYPGCESIIWDGDLLSRGKFDDLPDDPRSASEKLRAYRDQRRMAYPSVRSQLDMMYNDRLNGTDEWFEALSAIKAKYLKPEGV